MNMKIKVIIALLAVLLSVPQMASISPDDGGMERAKLLLFDKNWKEALREIDGVLSREETHPSARFYRGRCLEKLGRTRESLLAYTHFLKGRGTPGLREEAHISIIDLAFKLFTEGEKKFAPRILAYLDSPNIAIRYYAALKLSYLKDKEIANRAVPVLKSVIESEKDPELVDRARIGLLRINPKLLRSAGQKRDMEDSMLHIQVVNRKTSEVKFSISLPFMLARLALEALPQTDKEMLAMKGYSLDRIIHTLSRSRDLIRFEADEEVYRIWVEEN